jgi:hypothetical protein
MNHRRLCISAWLGLSAILLTLNFLKISQIEFQPLAPSPAVVSQLRLHLFRFEELLAARRADAEVRLDLPVVMTRLPQTSAAPSLAAPPRSHEAKPPPLAPPVLPHLTGILQVVHDTGVRHYCAVLDGHVFAEKDTIAGLRIEEISAAGVVLRRRDQRWFLPAPEVYFSISQRPY